ncbi:unnamed protein product [Sphacelaria rigidula]
MYGELREGIRMKTCLHGPMDSAKKLKLQFRVQNLDLPKIRRCFLCPMSKVRHGG